MSKTGRIKPLKPGTKIGIRQNFLRLFYPFWINSGVSKKLKHRRLNVINQVLGGQLFMAKRVLEVGCANGQDFVCLLKDQKKTKIYGIDLNDYEIKQDNFIFIHGDAEQIDYPDDFFDCTISIGVLEHIQPIEKLSSVIKEIDRVSKAYCVVVPSIGTILEPHAAKLFWHLRDTNKKSKRPPLNYYSDEAWKQFEGFARCSSKRFWYLPPLIQNLVIYKSDTTE